MAKKLNLKLADVTVKGSQLDSLVALRDRLAFDIDDLELSPRDRASISKELREILKEIENLKAPEGTEDSPLAQMQKRRAEG